MVLVDGRERVIGQATWTAVQSDRRPQPILRRARFNPPSYQNFRRSDPGTTFNRRGGAQEPYEQLGRCGRCLRMAASPSMGRCLTSSSRVARVHRSVMAIADTRRLDSRVRLNQPSSRPARASDRGRCQSAVRVSSSMAPAQPPLAGRRRPVKSSRNGPLNSQA
jgi:hypothetical protein